MLTLTEFIMANTEVITADSQGAVPAVTDEGWPIYDMVFADISADGEANRAQFEQLIKNQRPLYNVTINPLDGKFYNYITLGEWIGDQPTALRLLALGAALEVWTLVTPYSVGLENVTRPVALALAGIGLLGEVTP